MSGGCVFVSLCVTNQGTSLPPVRGVVLGRGTRIRALSSGLLRPELAFHQDRHNSTGAGDPLLLSVVIKGVRVWVLPVRVGVIYRT